MCHKARILETKDAPFSWKERDVLTAAEKYMEHAIDMPLIKFIGPCFPELDDNIFQKINQVWRYSLAGYHLNKIAEQKNHEDALLITAANIYKLEAQRIIGSIFPLKHDFWKAFYIRQEQEATKPLVALDIIYYATNCQQQIAYQLLQQSLKSILKGHYLESDERKTCLENAKRLLTDLPTASLQNWINHQLTKI